MTFFSDILLLLGQVTAPEIPTSPSTEIQVTEVDPMASMISGVVFLAFALFMLISVWKIYSKAGKPGWACIVPIYNIIVMLQIVGRPLWWILLLFIPIVGLVIAIILAVDLSKSYGKGGGFAMGLIFLPFIFYPILGFGSAQYQGPAAAQA